MTRLKPIILAAGLVALGLAGTASAAPARYFQSEANKALNRPFSDAVQVGDMVYLSGQIGAAPGEDKVVTGGMEAETRQVMENVRLTLQSQGLGFDDVVKCTVMLADMSKWGDFNKIYVSYFKPGHFPARSAFGANGLAKGAAVELECWAKAH
jgi:reactive intermediate/imine deaminase